MSVKPQQDQAPFGWLSFGPAVLTATGVFLYGLLNISYSRFYGQLGIDPEDVGLTYASTLTRSTGFVVVVVGIFIFGIAPFFWARTLNKRVARYEQDRLREREVSLAREEAEYEKMVRDRQASHERAERNSSQRIARLQIELDKTMAGTSEEQDLIRSRYEQQLESTQAELEERRRRYEMEMKYEQRKFEQFRKDIEAELQEKQQYVDRYARRRAGRGTIIAITLVVISLLGLVILIPLLTSSRVRQIRNGEEASPIHIAGLTVLATGANRATIQATSKAEENPAIEGLKTRSLLYLGQAGSTTVFYDSASNEAVYVPSSSIVVKVENK